MYKKNILQTIFSDHFEYVQYVIRPGKNVLDNIDKMIHCHDPSFGGAFFGCPHCGNLKFVPFSCKSRFCPSCGNMYNQKRFFRMSCKLVSCNHRHCVFTIPEELRSFFLKDHSLLNCLFHSVRDVILRMFFKLNKSENFNPGFICVPHTFGRDLKWNPHIHALISQGGAGNFTAWRPHTHFDYRFLRLSVKSFWSSSPLNWDRLLRNLKTRFTKTIPMGFMSGPNPIHTPLISLLNISADIWAGPSLPLPGLMPIMGLL